MKKNEEKREQLAVAACGSDVELGIVRRNRMLEKQVAELKAAEKSGTLIDIATATQLIQDAVTEALSGLAASGKLREAASEGSDLSVDDLMALCAVSKATAVRCITGRYKIGEVVRFRREEIDFYRATGKKLELVR